MHTIKTQTRMAWA